ncbi:DUF6256 family protein [Streptomyces sp. NPDC001514]
MLGGYLVLMGVLAFGLRIQHREDRRGEGRLPPTTRRGWPALTRLVAGTAVGGYLLLMALVVGYYYGVLRVSGRFVLSAVTGCAALIGIALPVFLAASWLVERRRKPPVQ